MTLLYFWTSQWIVSEHRRFTLRLLTQNQVGGTKDFWQWQSTRVLVSVCAGRQEVFDCGQDVKHKNLL